MALPETADVKERFYKEGFSLSDKQVSQFQTLLSFLLDYNKKVNLTAITNPDDVFLKHYLDSILPLSLVSVKENATVIDVGTGAGFPAIPLMILRPDLKVTLLDSTKKKTVYLSEVCERLFGKEEGYTVLHGRAEELGRQVSFREQYDVAISRAVANLSPLSEFCLPFVKVGGMFLAMKGADSELSDHAADRIKRLGGEIQEKIPYQLPNKDKRHLIHIKKIRPTPSQYPRNGGAILKDIPK